MKLGPMTQAELREVVERPAGELGVAFEPGLVDELVTAVGSRADALPLLEFALSDLWANQNGRRLGKGKSAATDGDLISQPLERHAEGASPPCPAFSARPSSAKLSSTLSLVG